MLLRKSEKKHRHRKGELTRYIKKGRMRLGSDGAAEGDGRTIGGPEIHSAPVSPHGENDSRCYHTPNVSPNSFSANMKNIDIPCQT